MRLIDQLDILVGLLLVMASAMRRRRWYYIPAFAITIAVVRQLLDHGDFFRHWQEMTIKALTITVVGIVGWLAIWFIRKVRRLDT